MMKMKLWIHLNKCTVVVNVVDWRVVGHKILRTSAGMLDAGAGKGVDSWLSNQKFEGLSLMLRKGRHMYCLGWDAWRHPVICATQRPTVVFLVFCGLLLFILPLWQLAENKKSQNCIVLQISCMNHYMRSWFNLERTEKHKVHPLHHMYHPSNWIISYGKIQIWA